MQLNENVTNPNENPNENPERPRALREGTFRISYYLQNHLLTHSTYTLLARRGIFQNTWDSRFHEISTNEEYNVLDKNHRDFTYPNSMFGTISPFFLNSEEYIKLFMNNNLMAMECVFSRAYSPLYHLAQRESILSRLPANVNVQDSHNMTSYFFETEPCI